MRIAVNCRFLLKDRLEGIGRYTFELTRRLCTHHPEVEFVLLFDRKYEQGFIFADNVTPRVLHPQARHPILWKAWFERAVPRALRRLTPDLFFSPDGFLSLRTKTKTLLVIHDLAFEHNPVMIPSVVRRYYKTWCPKYAERADHIITVSQFTKADIAKRYRVPAEKISVIHNGVSEMFKPLVDSEKREVRTKYSNGEPYFLFVSALQPRKNLPRLLEAFDAFKQRTGSTMKLLVAGAHTWAKGEIMVKLRALHSASDVRLLGHLNEQDLAQVMAAAQALTYVSLFEGFGIPIAEAMYAETPVITSNTSSMPEVAGDAALFVDPTSVREITSALERLASDDQLRADLLARGRTQRQKFNWDVAAREVWEVIDALVGS